MARVSWLDVVADWESRISDHALPDALDQDGKLVGDLPMIGVRVSQQGDAGAPPRWGDEQDRGVHLDRGLHDLTRGELPAGTAANPTRARQAFLNAIPCFHWRWTCRPGSCSGVFR